MSDQRNSTGVEYPAVLTGNLRAYASAQAHRGVGRCLRARCFASLTKSKIRRSRRCRLWAEKRWVAALICVRRAPASLSAPSGGWQKYRPWSGSFSKVMSSSVEATINIARRGLTHQSAIDNSGVVPALLFLRGSAPAAFCGGVKWNIFINNPISIIP